ncbi:hypothetical protein RRG08_004984 [Elysia crispata]|uniref:Uncharacterized protein n=1 Tax=Elysia crispata TaxID=231223 RepID=A0AAE1AYD9_9GAST|nr:hypothetical protein RRG08_004984 [Elysia crispata]
MTSGCHACHVVDQFPTAMMLHLATRETHKQNTDPAYTHSCCFGSWPEQSIAPSAGKTQPSLSIHQALNLDQNRVEHLVRARPKSHYQYSKL